MSELDTFFMRATVPKESFHRFMASAPTKPEWSENGGDWWHSRKRSDKTRLTSADLWCYDNATKQSLVEGWLENDDCCAFSDYDEASGVWHFGILFFSENYFELIPQLAFVQNIHAFRTLSEDDFAIVYDYFWDGVEVMAYMKFDRFGAKLVPEVAKTKQVPRKHLDYASAYFENQGTARNNMINLPW